MSDALAERLADWAHSLDVADIPAEVRTVAARALLDHAGLCVAARNEDYIGAILRSWDGEGGCTAFGNAQGLDAAGAALVNGTAAHGEDFDDTFEGSPVHATAVAMPAVLAACERYGRTGADLLKGYVVAAEVMCRRRSTAPASIRPL